MQCTAIFEAVKMTVFTRTIEKYFFILLKAQIVGTCYVPSNDMTGHSIGTIVLLSINENAFRMVSKVY